jgi:aspartyl/asparaginyl beta-hydroxylase (cupin superfamily)
MRVKDQYHTWEAGRSILFDDSWNHEVVNRSDDIRVVFIVDVMRPLPLHLHAANWVLTRLLMRHSEEARQVMANIKKYS